MKSQTKRNQVIKEENKEKQNPYLNKTVEELQKLLDSSIHSYNYQEAKLIQEALDTQKTKRSQDFSKEASNALIQEFEDAIHNYNDKCYKRLVHFRKKEITEREKYDKLFEEMREKHLLEIAELKDKQFQKYCTMMKAKNPTVDNLLDQSIKFAQNNNFEKAERLQADAKEKEREILKKKRDKFEEDYSKKVQELLSRQNNEITYLSRQLNSQIETINSEIQKALDQEYILYKKDMEKRYIATRSKYGLSKPSVRSSSKLSNISSNPVEVNSKQKENANRLFIEIYNNYTKGIQNQEKSTSKLSSRASSRLSTSSIHQDKK